MRLFASAIAAVIVLALATWFFLFRERPSGLSADSHAVDVIDHEAEGGAANLQLAPAPAMAHEPSPEPSPPSPTVGDVSPQPPATPTRPPITGTARLPAGERAASWAVIWQRPGTRTGGTVDIRDDGSFELPGSEAGSYVVSMRPKTALWPGPTWSKGATAATGMVVEPDALSAFRVQVEGRLPSDHPTAIQVESFESAPILRLAVTADQPSVEVAGIDDAHLYGIYVGPTSDGRYGAWQGRPKAGESVTISLRSGSTLRGRIDGGDDLEPASRRLSIHAFIGADVEVPVSETGSFEQAGLEAGCFWRIVATARSRKGTDLRAETTWKSDSAELVLKVEPVKK